jgi:predicted nucleotidyltransferase component of viral defense system
MNRAEVKDRAASVRTRLLNLSRERGRDFMLLLTHYALERFLYRLSISPHADHFVLKGAMRYMAWTKETRRPTRDLDLLGSGGDSAQELDKAVFEILETGQRLEDGLTFDSGIKVEAIREDQIYQGLRVHLTAFLGTARIPLQIDVAFGDAVTPAPEEIEYPILLADLPVPRIKAYPKESVVAEKLQALAALGMANSRMKDYYDMWTLAQVFTFEGPLLVRAIKATFQRRRTSLPRDTPPGLGQEFSNDEVKTAQWGAFLNKNQLETGTDDLPSIVAGLRRFLLPPLMAAASDEDFHLTWKAGQAWQ